MASIIPRAMFRASRTLRSAAETSDRAASEGAMKREAKKNPEIYVCLSTFNLLVAYSIGLIRLSTGVVWRHGCCFWTCGLALLFVHLYMYQFSCSN